MSNKNLADEKKNDEPDDRDGREKRSDDEEPSTSQETQSHPKEKPSSHGIPSRVILKSNETDAPEGSKEGETGNEKKKRKNLRFVLPDVTKEYDGGKPISELAIRFPEETAAENVAKLRIAPIPRDKPIRVSDVLRAVHVITDNESASSTYLNGKHDAVASSNLPHRTLVNMLRFETKREADCQLLLSTHFRNLNGVVEALKMGANVNVLLDHQTAITLATENNDKPIVKHLLTVENIDVNSRNIFGQTPLLIAIRNGYTEIATSLLNHENVDVNLSDNFERTPLHEALFQENAILVKRILDRECWLEIMDCFGEKPIYTAAVKKPNVDLLNDLLRAGAACDYINEVNGISLLSRAILNSLSHRIIQRLIEAGANVNEEDIFCKRTPLHIAVIINSIPVAKLLIENGADPNLKTISGLTALDLAIYYMCFDIAKYLASMTTSPNLNIEVLRHSLLRSSSNTSSVMLKIASRLRLFAKNPRFLN